MAASSSASPRFPRSSLVIACFFWFLAALRFLAVPPFVIDDDEAWWSAASNKLKTPWQFYRSAIDHKPPGVVWFYWVVNHLVPCASDPRVVRAVYTLISIVTAGVLGWIAFEYAKRRDPEAAKRSSVGWIAATIFLLVTSLPIPKMLAVTADGLIMDLVVVAYALALFVDLPVLPSVSGPIVSGMILGLALLVKQTAVFFAIPILFSAFPRKWSWKQIAGFLLGSWLVLGPCILALGVGDFFYWNWTYPKAVLITVRNELFDSNLEMIETLALFALASLPLVWGLFRQAYRAIRQGRSTWLKGLRDFRVLWLIAGLMATLMGKSLFFHYLLLFAPPFALLSADALVADPGLRDKSFAWLGIQAVAGALILMIPSSGIFWGTDLIYFDQLSRILKLSLRPGERIMVWGGSALPLAYTGTKYVTGFVLPRFAVDPYATPKTVAMFHRELAKDPPALILDLHERSDNQFDNPIQTEPAVNRLRKHYLLYVSETLPWAKFYFRDPPPQGAPLVPVSGAQNVKQVYDPFPRQRDPWMKLVEAWRRDGFSRAFQADWGLRMQASLELLEQQGSDAQVRARASSLIRQLNPDSVPPALKSKIVEFVKQDGEVKGMLPYPSESFAWWPSVALVELQPRAYR